MGAPHHCFTFASQPLQEIPQVHVWAQESQASSLLNLTKFLCFTCFFLGLGGGDVWAGRGGWFWRLRAERSKSDSSAKKSWLLGYSRTVLVLQSPPPGKLRRFFCSKTPPRKTLSVLPYPASFSVYEGMTNCCPPYITSTGNHRSNSLY